MKRIYQKFIAMLMVVCILTTAVLPTFVVYATDEGAEEPGFFQRAIDFVIGGEDKANLFERAISTCFIYIAAQFYGIIGMAVGSADGGQPLTIESLFFNHYTNTRLTLFSDMQGGENEFLDSGMKDTVNMFFKFFTSIAVIAYMMIMIYIGIRILFNAGTAQNAKYKEFVLYWVIGVAILFLFPYVMKYTIVINNAFVSFIDENKETIANWSDSVQQEQAGFANDGEFTLGDISNIFNTTHGKLMQGTDYMSLMYQLAFEKGWLVYTLCFIIMTKQLLTLIIVYFKRLLMTIFLIVIFPLVTISYAIDKLGDGKSQAFGNWCKEFVLNVFIQSFHAIVYVIGMAMIFKLGKFGDKWLILMMLITFISKGDELLRHIFNMNGSGAKTVADSGTRVKQTRGAMMLASKAGSVAAKKFGSESHLGKATQWAGQLAGNARDYAIGRMDESNAKDELSEFKQRHEMADLNAPRMDNATEAAVIALDENSTELERNKALDKILAVMNMEDGEKKEKELNDMVAAFKDNPEALKELEEMLKVRAAQNAIMVGGLTPVELNEQIEIILQRMKGRGLAAKMAAGLVTAHDLEKIRTAGKLKFRKPEEDSLAGIKGRGTSKSGGTRKKGDRYSGTFRTPAAYRMQQARRNQRSKVYKQIKTDVADTINPIKAGKEIWKGQYAKNTSARFKRVKAGATSVGDLNRRIRAAKKELRELERSGNKGTPAYRKIQENLNRWTQTASKSIVRKSRKGSAKVEQPGAVYNDSTGKIHENVERKKMAKKTKKTRDEVYEVAGVRDSFLKKQNINKRNTLQTSFGRPGQSASKFKVHGVKYTGFKNARISGKNALNAGRTGVSLKRPQVSSKPDYATSSTPTPKVSTQTKKVAKERRQNANARNNYASQGNPLTKHSAIRASRKEAQKELRDAQAIMRNSQSGTDIYKKAKEREAEAFKRLAEIQGASDRLNAKRGKKGSEIRAKGITLNSNGIKASQYEGQMKKASADDTSVHLIKPQKTMKERAEANALKRAVAKEPEPVSIMSDKFTEAMGRTRSSENSGTEKARLISPEVMGLAAKQPKVEEPKTSIKGMHSSTTKDSTIASQRETVIVVRDGSGGYEGATMDKNVISLSSKSDYEKAQKLVADVEKARASKVSTSGESSNGMTKEKIHETAMKLAASVTAINQSEYGDYTASEIVSHIDNIKAIMSSHKKGSEEYDVCLELVKKLQYDLSDFESSVRIQVLNDPSLIADSDPHRDRIMNSSISHVKNMGDEDILLTMLRYDQDKLEVGEPLGNPKRSGYQSVSSMASKGFAMGSDVEVLRNAFEDSLREKELQRRIQMAEKEQESNLKGMKTSAKNLASESIQATVDLAINVPLSVGGGLILGAMSSQNTQGALSGALGGYSTVDSTLDGARNIVGAGIKATGKLAGDIVDVAKPKTKTSNSANGSNNKKPEKPKEKKDKEPDLTSLGNGESLSERAKRMQNND